MYENLAKSLRGAYKNGVVDPLRTQVTESSEKVAYEIQKVNTNFWLEDGRRLCGRKIGLTSKSVQQQIGVDQPDFGMLFADMAYGSGEEIDTSLLLQPKVETEIAFVLEKDLNYERHTFTDIINATAYALPCIEVADSRVKDWDIKLFDTVADNASAGCFVTGSTPIKLSAVDMEMCGMTMECNGEVVSTGAGLACLGNPLNAAVWLANKMVEVNMPLKAGDIILSGALGPMVAVKPGDSFRASISGLGSVSIHFNSNTK